MARRRRNRSLAFAAALAVSALLHPALALLYEANRPEPRPVLVINVGGEGSGKVLSTGGEGIECSDHGCRATFAPGASVELFAARGEGATFEGWEGPCGPQSHRLFRWAHRRLLEGASLDQVRERSELFDLLGRLAETPPIEQPLACRVRLDAPRQVTATFGVIPEEQDVEWIAESDIPEPEEVPESEELSVTLPDPEAEAEKVVEPKPEPEEPVPEEMPIEEPEEPEVAMKEPPPPEVPKKQPKPQPKPKPKKKIETYRMKSVEVPDENKVEEAPDDAKFLSDENRDVAEETHAKDTNLERRQEGKDVYSEKSDIQSDEVGAKEEDIHQLEETEPSHLDAERTEETDHSGEDKVAEGVLKGEEGEGGQEGEGGDGSEAEDPGVMAMRGIDGRGAPGGPVNVPREIEEEGRGTKAPRGDGGKPGKPGKRGRRGIKTQLEYDDYKRIVGKDVAKDEVKVARRKRSKKRGRWEKKQAAIRSSLENFTPEVKPGNQTALKTRKAPFAVYIARMHRRIHELWGFGFLEDLEAKPSGHPMNDWSLKTKIEIVLNPDGSVDKTTIVQPSGVLTFDVAALDVIYTAGPFEAPPKKIASADGKVYMHWRFHRDWRQCGTFGVSPFILSDPPEGADRGIDDGDLVKNIPKRRKGGGRGERKGGGGGGTSRHEAAAATARATANMPTPDDPAAKRASRAWLGSFVQGDVARMVELSGVPFRSGDQVVANQEAGLKAVYKNILSEARRRKPVQTRLLSAAGYRKRFGALPPGADATAAQLFYVVRLKSEQFTLVLKPDDAGNYEVVAFHR